MKLKKPKFWDYKKPNIFAYFLWPISIILQFFNILKKIIISKKNFNNIKTICIGNIYIGGTGKTSLSLKLYEILERKKLKACFIKKDYIDQIDEQKLLEKKGKLFKSNQRVNALQNAIKENYKVAIFDDGLQDERINYDLCFLCFNNLNWIGNGFTIPSGPLRENLNNIKKYNNIFINGNLENLENIKKEILKIHSEANIYIGQYKVLNINEINLENNYLAFSGIGNHKTFVSTLKEHKINVVEDLEFPDHYKYSNKDLDRIITHANKINCKLITTEKDYLRINGQIDKKIQFVKSELIVDEERFYKEIILKRK